MPLPAQRHFLISCSISLVLGATTALSAADQTALALAKESEAQCVATAGDKPTPALIVAKVKEAAALVAKEGKAAFPAFKGKDSVYIFGGTYIWIHDMDGVMQMHPINPRMETRPLLGLRDANDKAFFIDMNKVAAAGGGWVDYMWPKPGDANKEPVLKVSYVAEAKHADGHFVIGCGVHDLTMQEITASGAK